MRIDPRCEPTSYRFMAFGWTELLLCLGCYNPGFFGAPDPDGVGDVGGRTLPGSQSLESARYPFGARASSPARLYRLLLLAGVGNTPPAWVRQAFSLRLL